MIKLMFLSIPFFFFPYYASAAYTWQFASEPRQCQNVSIDVLGSGQPPYSLLLIPNGPPPLPNNTEVRKIQNIPFPGSSSSLSFNLNYPEGSSFVAVVSDSSGFGTGGTSTPVTVLDSSDSSCYDPTEIQLPWLFYIEPSNVVQCDSVRWWWGQNLVIGTVNFYGVIPGGNSFNMPQGPLSTNTVTGTGFNWTVDISSGTNILIIGGDDRGIGTGGVAPFTVSPSTHSSCLNGTSPSSTAGNPAGGSYPTSTAGSSYPTSTSDRSNGSSGGHSHTGLIAGGIVGGLVVIALIFFYLRRRRYSAAGRPVNVLHGDEDGYAPYRNLPHYYIAEPYPAPDPTIGKTFEVASTPVTMTTVNIIQHDDAGPSEVPTSVGEPETIELPPAYANIRPAQRPPSTVPTRKTTSSTPALTKTTNS